MARTAAIRYRYRSRPRARRRASSKTTVPVAVLAGLIPTAAAGYDVYQQQGLVGGLKAVTLRLTGYDAWQNQWYAAEMLKGWLPIVAGFAAHKLAGKLGVNRALAKAGVPLLRV